MSRLLTFLLLLLAALPAYALESAPVVSPRARVSLVTDTDAIAAGVPFRVALRFQLAEGWHTYWKNPGDAGIPPEVTFEPLAGPIDWPAPSRVAEGTVMTYAYTGAFLLPVSMRSDGPVTLKVHGNWLVCRDICVPGEGDFGLVLPMGTPAPNAEAPLFAVHDRSVPRPSPWQASIAADGTLSVQGAAGIAKAVFIPNAAGSIDDDAPQVFSAREDGFALALKLSADF